MKYFIKDGDYFIENISVLKGRHHISNNLWCHSTIHAYKFSLNMARFCFFNLKNNPAVDENYKKLYKIIPYV